MEKGIKILVVDDNKDFCGNTKDILEQIKGYQVMTAYNGVDAIDLMKRETFDLAIMDMKMPIMDGLETFKETKEISPDTRVIVMTAYSDEDSVKEALREGAYGFLRKPLNFDRLFNLIERALPNGPLLFVVDDDKDLCANMKSILTDEGYRVSVAYEGKSALKKVRENNFDIMLIDMKLPGQCGLDVYLEIKDIRPNIVAIIITGYKDDMVDVVDEALNKDAYVCLEKPIKMEKLFSIIEEIKEEKIKGSPDRTTES